MPTYSYQCEKCRYVFDVFHAMSATPRIKCEKCGGKCTRQIGVGAGIIFKGSGFYETDYKNKRSATTEKASTAASEKPAAKSESKSESKPAAKTAKAD